MATSTLPKINVLIIGDTVTMPIRPLVKDCISRLNQIYLPTELKTDGLRPRSQTKMIIEVMPLNIVPPTKMAEYDLVVYIIADKTMTLRTQVTEDALLATKTKHYFLLGTQAMVDHLTLLEFTDITKTRDQLTSIIINQALVNAMRKR